MGRRWRVSNLLEKIVAGWEKVLGSPVPPEEGGTGESWGTAITTTPWYAEKHFGTAGAFTEDALKAKQAKALQQAEAHWKHQVNLAPPGLPTPMETAPLLNPVGLGALGSTHSLPPRDPMKCEMGGGHAWQGEKGARVCGWCRQPEQEVLNEYYLEGDRFYLPHLSAKNGWVVRDGMVCLPLERLYRSPLRGLMEPLTTSGVSYSQEVILEETPF